MRLEEINTDWKRAIESRSRARCGFHASKMTNAANVSRNLSSAESLRTATNLPRTRHSTDRVQFPIIEVYFPPSEMEACSLGVAALNHPRKDTKQVIGAVLFLAVSCLAHHQCRALVPRLASAMKPRHVLSLGLSSSPPPIDKVFNRCGDRLASGQSPDRSSCHP
jgi:hypothetical protein